MGISGFLAFLKKKVPEVIQYTSLSEFACHRVFIDISGTIYRYISACGKQDHRWIKAILYYLLMFRRHHVIPVPVFDGKPPKEKGDEIKERKEKRSFLQSRISSLKAALEDTKSPENQAILAEELKRLDRRQERTSSLLTSKQTINSHDIDSLQQVLQTLERQHVVITDEDLNLLKQIFTAFGISWLQSPSESESFCAFLVRQNEGIAMVSSDSDSLAHLSPRVIFDISNTGVCTYIELKRLLDALEITQEELIDYAILMGCDYNKHDKVNKLGPVNALKMIQQHHSIEQIPEDLLNKECLSYERCRELFQPVFDAVVIRSISIDWSEIEEHAAEWNLDAEFLRLWRTLSPPSVVPITFED